MRVRRSTSVWARDDVAVTVQKSSSSSARVQRTERHSDNDRGHPHVHGLQRAGQGRPGRLAVRAAAVQDSRVLSHGAQQRPRSVQLGRQLRRLLRVSSPLPAPPTGRRPLPGRRGRRVRRRHGKKRWWIDNASAGAHDRNCGWRRCWRYSGNRRRHISSAVISRTALFVFFCATGAPAELVNSGELMRVY